MTAWERDFIVHGRVARMATVDAHGHPGVVPIVYAFDGVFNPAQQDQSLRELL